ncbi:MAG: transglycosylase domain-containing protein [Sandaracinaceae bacterium]
MSRTRRSLLAFAALTALLTVVAGAAWLWWVPSLVESRIRAAAERRGLTADVAGVSGGVSAVELSGLRVRRGTELVVTVDRLNTGTDLFSLASAGTAAIHHLELDGVEVDLDVGSDLDELLRDLRGSAGAAEAPVSTVRRTASLRNVTVRLRDRRGTLVLVEGALVQVGSDTLTASAESTRVAPDESDSVTFGSVAVRVERQDDDWRVRRALVDSALIRYAERGAEERSPLWARLQGAVDRVGAIRSSESEGRSEDTEGGSDDADVPAAAHSPNTRESGESGAAVPSDSVVLAEAPGDDTRVGADVPEPVEAHLPDRADGPGDTQPVGEDDDHAPAVGPSQSTWSALSDALTNVGPHLADGAVFQLEDVAVEMISHGEPTPILRGLEAELVVLEGGRYRFEGSGRPGRGGRLGWNVIVAPADFRAEGRVDFQRLPFVLLLPVLPELPWYQPEETRMTGQLTVEGQGVRDVHLAGRVRVEDLALEASRIAPNPVRRIAFEVEGVADFQPLERRLTVSRVEVRSGDAAVQASGALEWPEDHYLVDLRATLPVTQCNAAVGAIPSDLLGELTSMTLRGQIGGRLVTHIDSRDLDATSLELSVADGCSFETVPPQADVVRFQAPFRHRVLEPDGSTFEMETGPETVNWVPLSSISPFFVQAVLGHEDGGFFRHSGFATHAIRTALIRNLTAGRFVYGASTITMQLVKNVFLHREKTLARKVQEVLLTWWVENAMTKAEILELYLNVIEYGPGVYGVRNAAEHYFGRLAGDLGPAEAAYLATILPNPPAFHEHWEDDEVPTRHRRRVERFLRTLHSRGRFDARALEYGLSRIADFDFHHSGEPLPRLHENPGTVRPLPIDPALFQGAWEEEFDEGSPMIDPWADDGTDGV